MPRQEGAPCIGPKNRSHVDPLNRLIESFGEPPGLTFDVEVRVRARDERGVVILERGWDVKLEPGRDRLQVAVVRGQRYWAPIPPLDERVERALRLYDSRWEFWLAQRELFWSYMNRSLGPDGHWYWQGTNCQHPSRKHRNRQWRIRDQGETYSISVVKLAWSYLYGPLPEGRHLLRTCSDERCDNPSHYYAPIPERGRIELPTRYAPTRVTKALSLQLSNGPVIAQYHEPLGLASRNG